MTSSRKYHWPRWFVTRSKALACALLAAVIGSQLAACAGPARQAGPATADGATNTTGNQTGSPAGNAPPPTAGSATAAVQTIPDPAAADSIYFAPGSSSISPAGRSKLKRLAQRLLADKRQVVTLIGHANDNGSASFNLAVADSRIGAVASALKKLGIAAHQIQRSVRGDEEVPADCRSSECRRAMRRVDLVFSQGGSNR